MDTPMNEETAVTDSDDPVTPNAGDDENDIDGCDVPIVDITPDEELPAAEGGVG